MTGSIHKALALLLLCLFVVDSCDINLKLKLKSLIPFYAQFTFFNGSKTEIYELDIDHKEKVVKMKGGVCSLKPTILKVWKEDRPENDKVKPFAKTSAHIDGMGNLTYIIDKDGPYMYDRFGTVCSFGDCGK